MRRFLVEVLRPITFLLSRLLYRIEFEGAGNVPPSGAVILTPNHASYPDPIWITIPLKRDVRYMAWDAIFRIPVFGPLCRFFGAFPVRIEGHDRVAYREALEHLEAGRLLVIFPEGGRTTTGRLLGFKPGAFRLALLTGTPVLPVTIDGAYEVWPPCRLLPRLRGRIKITFHAPIRVERVPNDLDNVELKRRAREVAGVARRTVASALDPAHLPEAYSEHPEDLVGDLRATRGE
jgi:1-acyl-sn-glycerol-3-phosphate acyltransferase